MNTLIESFRKYVACETVTLESDGYIGIPVEVTPLYDVALGKVVDGPSGTPIMLYVVNTATERIGLATDEEIVSSMLERGYSVLIVDYLGSPLSVSPAIDYSVQRIKRLVIDAKADGPLSFFGEGNFMQSFVVPAGYDVELDRPFWAFDKHGADGILEKITEIWNNDFRGTLGERVIKWTDAAGKRKKTVIARDESEPYWCNANGEPDENGEYTKVKYAHADNITDCVKPDGTMIDLNLYMHIVYPKNPKKPVPVMCLSSSTEHLASGASAVDRQHFSGAVFRGYAGVMFDYGYTPMARRDHYGYFDGYPKAGYVTGDNATYSMSFYNDKRIFTAAMRYIRYLALSDKNFSFDINAIGVYGNSKGSWMTFLGQKKPENLTSKRILAGHHDETRYEAGNTNTVGLVRGGEEQPWLKYGEIEIKSQAELIYSSTGGLDESITAEHSPVFISSNRRDSSCYGTSNAMYAACLMHDVPAMNVDVNLPHTIVNDTDLVFGVDAYGEYFDFCGYYLKGDAVKVVGIKENINTLPYSVAIRFSGSVKRSEVTAITLTSALGNVVLGKWTERCGGIDWLFTPDALDYSTDYTVRVPGTLVGDNSKAMGEDVYFVFTSPKTYRTSLIAEKIDGGVTVVTVPAIAEEGRSFIEVDVTNDGFNRISLSDESGKEYAFVNTSGLGKYRMNVTDMKLPEKLVLSATRDTADTVVFDADLSSGEGFTFGKRAKCSFEKAPDGTSAVKIDGFDTVTEHPTEEFYIYPDAAFTLDNVVSNELLTKDDMGRSFKISFKVYDTTSRYVKISLSHATAMVNSIIDYRRCQYNLVTKAGEWVEVELDYTVYEMMYSDYESVKKTLTVSCYGKGTEDTPLYIGNIKTMEKLSALDLGSVYLVTEKEPKDVLPEGKSDIICHKSPWQK